MAAERRCDERLDHLRPLRAEPTCAEHMKAAARWPEARRLAHWLACPHNDAFNRLTRSLGHTDCVSDEEATTAMSRYVDEARFERALHALQFELDFFALLERQADSLRLFESTFGVTFDKSAFEFHAPNGSLDRGLSASAEAIASIRARNQFDVRLYREAERLFEHRQRVDYCSDS